MKILTTEYEKSLTLLRITWPIDSLDFRLTFWRLKAEKWYF